MILGFHYHVPAWEKNGSIQTAGSIGVFLDGLARNVDELVCFMHTPLPSEEFMMDYQLKENNIKLVSLGPHHSVPLRLVLSPIILLRILPKLRRLDMILIRCPTPFVSLFKVVKSLKKSFLIVGDYKKSMQDLYARYWKKKLIQLWASANKWQQDRAIINQLVFVNSGILFDELKSYITELHLTKTTTLNASDFFHRMDTCLSSKINLLYTGRLDLSKGLKEMVITLSRIRSKGYDAYIHFVGWEEKNKLLVTNEITSLARELGIADFVVFHGKKKVGIELNEFYRMADIFIIGSRISEGFPRTIWESFANSLPVIASAVPSLPYFIAHKTHALLTKPGSVDSMTDAVLLLLSDGQLRRELIANAYNLAESNTLDKQCKSMIDTMSAHLSGNPTFIK